MFLLFLLSRLFFLWFVIVEISDGMQSLSKTFSFHLASDFFPRAIFSRSFSRRLVSLKQEKHRPHFIVIKMVLKRCKNLHRNTNERAAKMKRKIPREHKVLMTAIVLIDISRGIHRHKQSQISERVRWILHFIWLLNNSWPGGKMIVSYLLRLSCTLTSFQGMDSLFEVIQFWILRW